MVKPEYTYNSGNLCVLYQRMREGTSYFTVYYKNRSQLVTTVKEMKQILGSAKLLPSSKDLYEWMEQLINKAKPAVDTKLMDKIKKEGFGPEAHQEEEPNDNTKMVT